MLNRLGAAFGPDARRLLALIGGQICQHASMAGLRLAGPLWALHAGYSPWWVGVLLALFAAAPIATALHAGRAADRHGYHRPLRASVALVFTGGAVAVVSSFAAGAGLHAGYGLLCLAAVLSGAGANAGLITIQRAAGRMAAAREREGGAELMRVFSWLGLAPSLANMLGSLVAGVLIDAAGYRMAFVALAALPLGALAFGRRVPAGRPAGTAAAGDAPKGPLWRSAVELSRTPGLRRLLLVNWLMSTSWDVHGFLVPILGHSRGLSASAIGTILAVFAIAVSGVRVVIPVLAHRLRESVVLAGAMLVVGAVFGVYPLTFGAWTMGACAVVLGLALGVVQPMIMSTLHQLTPAHRHGEAIALRSMAINLSSTLMPLGFGVLGSALGAGALFWLMGAAVGAGSLAARRLDVPARAESDAAPAQ
jgi:MFS family permease